MSPVNSTGSLHSPNEQSSGAQYEFVMGGGGVMRVAGVLGGGTGGSSGSSGSPVSSPFNFKHEIIVKDAGGGEGRREWLGGDEVGKDSLRRRRSKFSKVNFL